MKFFGLVERLRAQLQDEFAPRFVRIRVESGWDIAPNHFELEVNLHDMTDYQINSNFDKSITIRIPLDADVIEAMGKTEDDLFKYVKLAIEFQTSIQGKEAKAHE